MLERGGSPEDAAEEVSTVGSGGPRCDGRLPVCLVAEHGTEVTDNVDDLQIQIISAMIR